MLLTCTHVLAKVGSKVSGLTKIGREGNNKLNGSLVSYSQGLLQRDKQKEQEQTNCLADAALLLEMTRQVTVNTESSEGSN